MQNASATPGWPVLKKIKDTCRWRYPFWLSLDLSTPIFRFEHLDIEYFFRNWLGLGQSTPIFFSAINNLNIFRIALPTDQLPYGATSLRRNLPTAQPPYGATSLRSNLPTEQQSSSSILQFSSGWTLIKLLLWIPLSTKHTLTSFTVEPFKIYFEDLMWLFTHLCRLDKQDSRLKISLSWHFTSSLKTLTVELNIF